MSSSANSGDWWELTNTGATTLDLTGYYWDDNGPMGADGAQFPSISITPGQSIVIVDEDAVDLPAFVAAWGGGFTAVSKEDFGGPDNFSGLGSGGDQIELWDSDPNAGPANLMASVSFGGATAGTSFEWDATGNSLALSVNGENGAFLSTGGDIGSPGAIPEPSTAILGGLGLIALLRRRR